MSMQSPTREPETTRSVSSPTRPWCRRGGGGPPRRRGPVHGRRSGRGCPGGSPSLRRPARGGRRTPRPGERRQHHDGGARATQLSMARLTSGSGSWPGSCSTTGRKPADGGQPVGRPRLLALASGATGRKPPGPNSVAASPTSRIWVEDRGRVELVAPAGTSHTPHEIGAPATRSSTGMRIVRTRASPVTVMVVKREGGPDLRQPFVLTLRRAGGRDRRSVTRRPGSTRPVSSGSTASEGGSLRQRRRGAAPRRAEARWSHQSHSSAVDGRQSPVVAARSIAVHSALTLRSVAEQVGLVGGVAQHLAVAEVDQLEQAGDDPAHAATAPARRSASGTAPWPRSSSEGSGRSCSRRRASRRPGRRRAGRRSHAGSARRRRPRRRARARPARAGSGPPA